MRVRPSLFLLVSFLSLAPSALGQSLVLEDPAGDLVLEPGGPVPAGSGRWASTDLLGLEVWDTPTEFWFRGLMTPAQDPTRTALVDETTHDVRFRVGSVAYDLEVYEYLISDAAYAGFFEGTLYAQDSPGGDPHAKVSLSVDGDGRAGYWETSVPRWALVDEHGVEPAAGSALTDLSVEATALWTLIIDGDPPSVHDRMPDQGDGQAPVRFGVRQSGHLTLTTDQRIVASNGEATTYLFRINATDHALYEDAATLTLVGVPAAWDARLPFQEVRLPANGSIEFPLLLTVPFQHQHGTAESFVLEARSDADPDAVARLEIGVEYLAIPQPAGHHDTLYLHSRTAQTVSVQVSPSDGAVVGPGPRPVMNSLPEDPQDTGSSVPADYAGGGAAGPRYGWVVPLEPGLRIGIDQDLDHVGEMTVGFRSSLPFTGAGLDGALAVVPRDNLSYNIRDYDTLAGVQVLADIATQTTHDLGDSTAWFDATVTPRPESEVTPRSNDNALVLLLWLQGTGAPPVTDGQEPPRLEPGAMMRLALDEYHDPIDAAFAAPAFLHLEVNGPTERRVAPGGTLLYNLTLRNDGPLQGTFRVTVSGDHADWARLPRGQTLEVGGNGTATLAVAVAPPVDAREGEAADLIVEAVEVQDARMRGLVRLVATVDGDPALRDDTTLVAALEAEAEKDTPFPTPLLLVAFAAAAAVRRFQEGGRSGRGR